MQGTLIGNYRITKQIGQGGMGTVWEAVHQQIHQRCAVKLLRPQFSADKDAVKRFFLEARTIGSLQHPGLVKAYDFGKLPDGTVFLLMELLEGETLSRRLGRVVGHLALTSALNLARQIAAALAVVHERGIVHRDLKPGNVFIVPEPESPCGERIKLVDFGMAKLLSESTLLASGATGPGPRFVVGTPHYMAPEQVRAEQALDGRADVYSLGVILFQMLTGRRPFEDPDELQVLRMQMDQPPPALAALAPQAPPDLCALVGLMLSKDPRRRPTMAKVAERLSDMAGEPDEQMATIIDVGPRRAQLEAALQVAPGVNSSGLPPLQRHGAAWRLWPVALGLLCLLLMALGAGLWLRRAAAAAGARSEAVHGEHAVDALQGAHDAVELVQVLDVEREGVAGAIVDGLA